jgi:hypothetical protein
VSKQEQNSGFICCSVEDTWIFSYVGGKMRILDFLRNANSVLFQLTETPERSKKSGQIEAGICVIFDIQFQRIFQE